MQLRDFHGAVTTLRDVILREVQHGFAEHSGVTVGTAHYPWELAPPCIGILGDQPFSDLTEAASQCQVVVRFELMFAAGAPGADHVGALSDHWLDYALLRYPMKDIAANDELWDFRAPPPRFDRVDRFEIQNIGGQEIWGATSVIKTEMHQES